MWKMLAAGAALALTALPASAAEGLFAINALTPETALKAAKTALDSCRAAGYQVAVAVVDRGGNVQVLLRDRFAGPHTPEAAIGKAWTSVSFRQNTTEMLEMTGPGKPSAGMRELSHVVMLGGGMKIEAAGAIVAGIGVSGAPGGHLDDACAEAGIKAITDDLNF
jgi:uncharacterized protein GlcG (DUF336 family)